MTQTATREGIGPISATATESLRPAGFVMLGGVLLMVIGAGLYFSTGADLWESLQAREMAAWLTSAADNTATLYANLAFWIAGSVMLGVGGALATHRVDNPAGRGARFLFGLGPALSVPAFIAMASIVRLSEAADASAQIADTVGFVGARLDDLATVILVAIAPVLLVVSARNDWVPRWLRLFGYVAGVAGLLSLVTIFTGYSALSSLIIPIGLGWTVSAGVVAVRAS